ncbi:hypothetical protein Hanom_Chr00s059891g01784731 [Helianthus anomalus]
MACLFRKHASCLFVRHDDVSFIGWALGVSGYHLLVHSYYELQRNRTGSLTKTSPQITLGFV